MAIAGAGWLAFATPVRADDSIADLFKDFVINGCIGGIETGVPIAAYAQGLGLTPATPNLAAAFLRGRPGTAYIKATPQTVLIIAETGETCTVASRVAPDAPALTQATETALAGLKTPLTFVREEKRPVVGGGTATTREYDGAIGSRPYGVLLSITETAPQATVTVYRKAR